MKLKEDQVKIKELLKDTITLLCKNGLQYKLGFSVEALIGITLDEEDVFLVNIKESVRNDDGKNSGVEVTVRKAGEEETDNESESGRSPNKHEKKSARKRPPDGSPSFGDLPSPAKFSRTEMDETSNASEMSKDSMLNIKAEPEDDDELVFVKEEGTEYSSCSQQQQQSQYLQQTAMISTQGFPTNPTFPPQSFDTTPADSLPGMSSWNTDQANISGANQSFSSPRTSSQQNSSGFFCPLCRLSFSRKSVLIDHLRGIHGYGDPFTCPCGQKFNSRASRDRHRKVCTSKEIANKDAENKNLPLLPSNKDLLDKILPILPTSNELVEKSLPMFPFSKELMEKIAPIFPTSKDSDNDSPGFSSKNSDNLPIFPSNNDFDNNLPVFPSENDLDKSGAVANETVFDDNRPVFPTNHERETIGNEPVFPSNESSGRGDKSTGSQD